ncbi:MAG: DUF3060 domain-containing protein [Rubripirellula sp.]
MSDPSFDPYHKWLGIPASEQPANHYRLLGLAMFESDTDVIDSAAARQTTYVRSFAIGQHGDLSQSILNEIAKAKLTLLDPETKRQYDDTLVEPETQSRPLNAMNRPVAAGPVTADRPAAADRPVAPKLSPPPVRCPSCGVGLAISEALFGKTVQCTKCKMQCQVSDNGRAVLLLPVGATDRADSSADEYTLSEPVSLSRAKSNTLAMHANVTKRRAKTSLSMWLVAISFVLIGILGIIYGVSLLWSVPDKDRPRITATEFDAQQRVVLPPIQSEADREIEQRESLSPSIRIRQRNLRQRDPTPPIRAESAGQKENQPSQSPVRTEPNTTNGVRTIVASQGATTFVNGPTKNVVVTGACSSVQVGGAGYNITIEQMVDGEIKLSGFDHRLHVTGSVIKILGSGLRHQLIVEELGQVVMSGNDHELSFVRSHADPAVSLGSDQPAIRSTRNFKQIEQIAKLPPPSRVREN